jgi:hypothetical protein
MSTTQDTVEVDLLGERREGEFLEEIPDGDWPHGPQNLNRVDVDGTTWRVPEEDVHR